MIACRPAHVGDKITIFQLANQLHEQIDVDEKVFQKSFDTILKQMDQFLIVAEMNGLVVGYFIAHKHLPLYANGPVMHLDEIVVSQDMRKQNVGKILMQELEHIANQQACKLISLATAGAIGFYEKLGYTTGAGYYKKYLRSS